MERTRFRGDLEHGSATGLFGFVATTVRVERGVMASTGGRSIMVRRSTVRRDFGAPGLRHTLASTIALASAVRRTSVRRVCGTLVSTIALASSVRRDFGAPGLRCTEATSSAASTHGRPGSPHRSEQRAAPAVLVPRTGLLDPAASHGRTPGELDLRRVLDPEGTTPAPISGRSTRPAARLPATCPAPRPLGARILLLTSSPSWIPSTPRRLCGSMLSRAYVDHLAPRRPGNSGSGAVRGADLLRDGRDRHAAPGRVERNAATRPGDAVANGSRSPHRRHVTNSRHLVSPQAAARRQQAHRDAETATTTLGNAISLLLAVPREPHGERKCQFRIFTCNAPTRKPTQLGADGRACGARGGAARLRRPTAAQANVRLMGEREH